MSTRDRKARKRAGVRFAKRAKMPTRVYGQVRGLGLVTMPELLFGMVIRGASLRQLEFGDRVLQAVLGGDPTEEEWLEGRAPV